MSALRDDLEMKVAGGLEPVEGLQCLPWFGPRLDPFVICTPYSKWEEAMDRVCEVEVAAKVFLPIRGRN